MSGTDIAYVQAAYALATRCPALTWRMVQAAYACPMPRPVLTLGASTYALTTQCPVLTSHMLLPGRRRDLSHSQLPQV
eukprot:1478590-Rhodomonas_salina.3